MTVPFLKGLTSKQLLEMQLIKKPQMQTIVPSFCMFLDICIMQKMHIFKEIIIIIFIFIIIELDISTISGWCPQQKIKPAKCSLGSVNNMKQLQTPTSPQGWLKQQRRRCLKMPVTCRSEPSSLPLCSGFDLTATVFISPGLHCYHSEARRWAILLNGNAPIEVQYVRD